MASEKLFALFLVSALTFYPPLTSGDFVKDVDGNNVRSGDSFYLTPLYVGTGGGIERAKTGNETSALSVVQSPLGTNQGQAWRFRSISGSHYLLEESISISFENGQLGYPPNVWSAVEDPPAGRTLVKVGYTNAVLGYFGIRRASKDNGCKFVFCPIGIAPCTNVGIIKDAGNRLLAIYQRTPFVFVLTKVPSAASK